jgi:hypothetical protein
MRTFRKFSVEIIQSFLSILYILSVPSTSAEPWTPHHYPLEGDPSDIPQETPEHHYEVFRRIDSVSHPGRYELYQTKDPSKKVQAILWVSNRSKALVEQQAFFDEEKKLSLAAAKLRFGEPRRFGHIAVFDLIGDYWKEPTIYHLDIEFDGRDIAQKYLMRGPGILPEKQFLELDVQQIGKHTFAQPKPELPK